MSEVIMPDFYTLPFIKMQALGNDFIFLDGKMLLESEARPLLSQWLAVAPQLARYLCHRRLSIGADGLILAMSLAHEELRQLALGLYGDFAKDCDLSWTYHNNDGSQSHMCGNGLRCLALWAKQNNNIRSNWTVATQNGPVKLNLIDENNITTVLPAPKLTGKEIPFAISDWADKKIVRYPFTIDSMQFPITCVNVGNPHCLIFEANFLTPDLFKTFGKELPINVESPDIGQEFFPRQLVSLARNIEIDQRFPERTNVHFIRVIDRHHIQMFIWRRGVDPTLASASAAVSAFIAGVLEDRLDRQVEVTLPGGKLLVEWLPDGNIQMTGPARFSFIGQVKVERAKLKIELGRAKASVL